MTVSQFNQTGFATQPGPVYFPTLDGDVAVFARVAAAFAPHEDMPPSMAIAVDAGALLIGTTLTEVPAQLTASLAAPVTDPRIDRVVIDRTTGTALVVAGVEAASPTPPALPADSVPVAQVLLTPATTAITNADITDERVPAASSAAAGSLVAVQTFTAPGTYTPTPGTNFVIVEMVGAGASGGGCQAGPSAGGGGGAGAYARGLFTSGFAGVTVTPGAGTPAGAAGVLGTDGQDSSFGTLMVAPGGQAGFLGTTGNPKITWGSNISNAPTGANLVSAAGCGGEIGLVLSNSVVHGGSGGKSAFGANSMGSLNAVGSGSATAPHGAGGGGASSTSTGPARAGGAGNPGLVLVYEYS